MIEGLKLTFSGEELRTLLEAQIQRHEQRADWWTHEQSRTPEDATEDEPLLPDHICTHEAERHVWRSRVLTFIRDHVETTETYRLDAANLESGELLPVPPGWLEQEEYEERTRVAFGLERLTKAVTGLVSTRTVDVAGRTGEVINETDEFRTTRLDLEDGPEVIVVERK